MNKKIKIERISSNDVEAAIKLASKIFYSEQSIPKALNYIDNKLEPIWWCAKLDDEIIGTAAAWREEGKWHWGRFCVDKKMRGNEIGKGIAKFSLNEIFNLGAEKVFIEARHVTVRILEKYGCKIVGDDFDFYGQPITPITIEKNDFINSEVTMLRSVKKVL